MNALEIRFNEDFPKLNLKHDDLLFKILNTNHLKGKNIPKDLKNIVSVYWANKCVIVHTLLDSSNSVIEAYRTIENFIRSIKNLITLFNPKYRTYYVTQVRTNGKTKKYKYIKFKWGDKWLIKIYHDEDIYTFLKEHYFESINKNK